VERNELKGKKVSVIGAGRSGIAAALLLSRKGAEPFLSDHAGISEEELDGLRSQGIPFEQGGHSPRVHDADLCIVSPGVPLNVPVVRTMEERGVPVYSEVELASWFCTARIIAITGTDGKTTTTTLIHRICETDGRAAGYRAYAVGNIGVPFSSKVLEMAPADVAVLELSSYQLERSETFRPDIAVMTNITPDHLDRYGGDIQNYARAKFRIYANQESWDTLVYNHDDPFLRQHFSDERVCPSRLVPFGIHLDPEKTNGSVFLEDGLIMSSVGGSRKEVAGIDEIMKRSFRGDHNLSNALASSAAAVAAGIAPSAIREALLDFRGVEHRQEFAGNAGGLEWINDSKATNLNAMRQALLATPGQVVLIAGGRDKGNDYRLITDLVLTKVTCIIAIGESKMNIAKAFDGIVSVRTAGSLAEAVSLARSIGSTGQSVLFSPGCASFDMFTNYEERGKLFKQLVRELDSC
jgi:UDP-N-acetylmuramoylalanine--D-glutamate ligase